MNILNIDYQQTQYRAISWDAAGDPSDKVKEIVKRTINVVYSNDYEVPAILAYYSVPKPHDEEYKVLGHKLLSLKIDAIWQGPKL